MENLKAFFTRRPERLLGRCGMLFLMAFFVMNLSSCNDDFIEDDGGEVIPPEEIVIPPVYMLLDGPYKSGVTLTQNEDSSYTCLLYTSNRPKEIEFKKGSNWVSITHELLTIILAQKSFILRRFKNVCCGDEIFLQSILWSSERRSHIYPGSEQLNAGLRAIDWERGNPYVWKMEDLQYLLETEHLFARKFDSQNMDVVIKIRELFS